MRHLSEVFKANQVAIANYQPKAYSGKVALFCASFSTEDRGRSSLTKEKLETYTIPGNHYKMMQSPYIQVLAKELGILCNENGNAD